MTAATMRRDSVRTKEDDFARRWKREIDAAAGSVYRYSGPAKVRAKKDGTHISTQYRFENGAPYSSIAKALLELADSPITTAWMGAIEATALVVAKEMSKKPMEQVTREIAELEREHADLERDLRIAGFDGDIEREIQTEIKLSLLHLKRAAALRVQRGPKGK